MKKKHSSKIQNKKVESQDFRISKITHWNNILLMSIKLYLSECLPDTILLMKFQILGWSNKITQKILTLFVVSSSIPAEYSSSRSHHCFLACFDRSNRKGLRSYTKENAPTQNLLFWGFCCIIDNNHWHLNNTAELTTFIRWITIHPDLCTQMTFFKNVRVSLFCQYLPTYPTSSPAHTPVLDNREVCKGPADPVWWCGHHQRPPKGQKHKQNCRLTYESKGISWYS